MHRIWRLECIHNVLHPTISTPITLFCVCFSSFCVSYNDSKVPVGSAYAKLWLLDKYIFKHRTCSWVGKTMDVLFSSITYTYDINKHIIVSKRNLYITPQSLIFQQTYMTSWARFSSKNCQQQTHSAFLVAVSPRSSPEILTKQISRKLPVKATYVVHFIYPKVRVHMVVKE